jgi:hypothetical protein
MVLLLKTVTFDKNIMKMQCMRILAYGTLYFESFKPRLSKSA